jgi:hypothetical protein
MVPCGIAGVDMTSVERELLEGTPDGRPCLATPPGLMDDVRDATVDAFAAVFGLEAVRSTDAALRGLMGNIVQPPGGTMPILGT